MADYIVCWETIVINGTTPEKAALAAFERQRDALENDGNGGQIFHVLEVTGLPLTADLWTTGGVRIVIDENGELEIS